jgi:polyphosphate kinase
MTEQINPLKLRVARLKKGKNMETTVFNPIQLHLLQMFSHMKSEEELKEVQQELFNYFFKKLEKRAARYLKNRDGLQNSLKQWLKNIFVHHINENCSGHKLSYSYSHTRFIRV